MKTDRNGLIRIGIALILGLALGLLLSYLWSHHHHHPASCRPDCPAVTITAPSRSQQVQETVTAQGTARHIPRGTTLWLIVQAGNGFYPQAELGLPPSGTGTWAHQVTFGPGGAGQTFTLYAVGADAAASRRFDAYLTEVKAGQKPPSLTSVDGAVTYAQVSVVRVQPPPPPPPPPSVSIVTPKSVARCLTATAQCEFGVTGHSVGATSALEILVLVYPLNPPGAGWYLQSQPATIAANGGWTQSPSYIGAAAFPAQTGNTLRIEVALVPDSASYHGTRLSVLAAQGRPIPDPRQIKGLVGLSNIVTLRILR